MYQIILFFLVSLTTLNAFSSDLCRNGESVLVTETYKYSSTVAVMYGGYGVGNSEDDKLLAKAKAETLSLRRCRRLGLTECQIITSKIIENVSLTQGIPYVRAKAWSHGCK